MGFRYILVPAALAACPVTVSGAVRIVGIEGALAENVAEYIEGEPVCEADDSDVDRYLDELPQDVLPALEAFGYYEPSISATAEERTEECWIARLEVRPGPPVRVDTLDLKLEGEAAADDVVASAFDAFPLKRNDVLRHGDYSLFKSRIEALARERGYLDARFANERIDVYVQDRSADVTLVLDSGPRYAFGPVTWTTDALASEVLDDLLTFEEGAPYDASAIAQLQRDLVASRYFSNAMVVPEIDRASGRNVPVRVDAVVDEPTSYSVGAGFSTDDGPRFRFTYENRLRNWAGHQMDGDLLLSAVRQNANFDYRVPIGNPLRDWLSFRAGVAREDIDAGVGAAARFGVRRTRVVDALTTTRFLDVLIERDDFGDEHLSTQLLVPGVSWARSVRDDLVRPREGHRLSFGVSLGVGDLTLVHFDLHGKWIRSTSWDGRVIVRGRAGIALENGDFELVPLSMRFFAGGDNSVRGYDYESLGPRDAEGNLIGGNRLLEASVEYEHPVRDAWSVAAFVDSGNAFLDSSFRTRTGAGIGARWFSPIGPVRLDIAWPLNPPSAGDRSPQLHISLGPDL